MVSLYIYFVVICLPFFSYGKVQTSNDFLFSGEFDFIDLTHAVDNNSTTFLNLFRTLLRNKITDDVSEMDVWNYFGKYEHVGTHIDASAHNRNFIGDIPLQKLILPLIVVDISSLVNDNENFILYKYHLDYMLNNYFGRNWQPCLIIFKFGWSKFFDNPRKYFGMTEADEPPNFPGLSIEVAEWITTTYKNVVGVGADVPSVDPASSVDYRARKILLDAGLYILENVKMDNYIPEASCTALVMPVKHKRQTGSVRLIAICPSQHLLTTPRPSYLHF